MYGNIVIDYNSVIQAQYTLEELKSILQKYLCIFLVFHLRSK